MIFAYGVANLLQSIAAARTSHERRFHPSLLLRLAGQRTYLLGVGCQILAFLLAFLARRELPLFLVQASVAAGLGVTAVLGVVVLRWRLPAAEVGLLAALGVGIAALIVAAEPAPSRQLNLPEQLVLGGVLALVGAAGVVTVRLRGALGSVVLGALAGVAFGAAAIASRPLAGVDDVHRFVAQPLLYLVLAHSLVGQLLLGLAMQRGSTTAAVAAMDAAAAVPAAVIGLVLLGDRIWPGREWLATAGFLITLGAVVGLTRYAEPQHHHEVNRARMPARMRRLPATSVRRSSP
jgi:hypothetical protein